MNHPTTQTEFNQQLSSGLVISQVLTRRQTKSITKPHFVPAISYFQITVGSFISWSERQVWGVPAPHQSCCKTEFIISPTPTRFAMKKLRSITYSHPTHFKVMVLSCFFDAYDYGDFMSYDFRSCACPHAEVLRQNLRLVSQTRLGTKRAAEGILAMFWYIFKRYQNAGVSQFKNYRNRWCLGKHCRMKIPCWNTSYTVTHLQPIHCAHLSMQVPTGNVCLHPPLLPLKLTQALLGLRSQA